MGNTNKARIAVLDSRKDISKDYQAFKNYNQFQMSHYKDFTDFISKQNPQQIKNIILRYDEENYNKKIKQKKTNNLKNICLFLETGQITMKDQLINYVQKYNLHTNIYLYTGKKVQVKIEHYQKPFIKLVSNNLEYILNSTSQPAENFQTLKKMDNLFEGFFRKVMVKILGEPWKKNNHQNKQKQNIKTQNILKQTEQQMQLLQSSKIFPLYYSDIESLQKSFISTACEYVICSPEHSFQVRDCKKKCEQQFNIIVKGICNQSFVWAAHQELSIIIKKMKNFTQISQQQRLLYANNIIVMGSNRKFEQQINVKQLEQRICNTILKLKQQQNLAKNVLKYVVNIDQQQQISTLQQKNEAEQKLGQNKIKVMFTTLQKQNQLLKQLQKSIYSFILVLSQDKCLQQIKRFLRNKKFENRVQLTSLKQDEQLNKYPHKIWQYKSKLLDKITYQLRFQIGPITSIHLYQPQKQRVSYFNQKLGLKVNSISKINQLTQNYLYPRIQKIIDSKRLVCNLDQYLNDIKLFIQQYRHYQTIKRLKIIIFDQNQDKIRKYINRVSNPSCKIVQKFQCVELIEFNRTRLENHLKNCKASKITIPFYRNGVLKNFENQCNLLASYNSSFQLNLKSSVYRSNIIMKEILNNKQKDLATQYNLNFLIFKANKPQFVQQITEFQQKYIPYYLQIWEEYYQIITTKQNKIQVSLQSIKQQICFLFYRCKAYDLLKVRQEDFQQFYIQKIKACRGLLDLQLACIYILTLPHGFNQVISGLFMKKKKAKLAIKIFITYMLVLMSSFYNFKAETQNQIKLVVFLQKDNKNKLFNNLQNKILKGDIFYTTDFVFCIDKQQQANQYNQFHTVVFSFNNHQVLQKTLLQNYLYVEKCAFYKEVVQYIIPPFIKFKVTQIKKINGSYEICLQNLQQEQCIFADQLFKKNKLTQQMVYQLLCNQLTNDERIQRKQQNIKNFTSLYKKTQNINMKKVKQEVKQQFKNGQNYNNFFIAKNNKLYLSALMYLNKTHEKQKEFYQKETTQNQQDQKIKFNQFQVETSYVQYQMNQYQLALQSISKLLDIYQKNRPMRIQFQEEKTWKQLAAQKIKQSILFTKQQRKKYLLNIPHKKLWKLKLLDDKAGNAQTDFKLQAVVDRCQVNFEKKLEIFYVDYIKFKNKNEQQSIMTKKILKYKQITAQIAPDLFGQKVPAEVSKKLFISIDQYRKKYNNNNPLEIKEQNIVSLQHKQEQNPFESLYWHKSNIDWSVFYFKNQPQVAFKKQHFHKKLPTLNQKATVKKAYIKSIEQTDNIKYTISINKNEEQEKQINDTFSLSNQKQVYMLPNEKSSFNLQNVSFIQQQDSFSLQNNI